jgi:hypothetical protein
MAEITEATREPAATIEINLRRPQQLFNSLTTSETDPRPA